MDIRGSKEKHLKFSKDLENKSFQHKADGVAEAQTKADLIAVFSI